MIFKETTIECEQCFLRPLKYDDAEQIASLANDYNIWKNVTDNFPYPYRVEHAINFIRFANEVEKGSHWAIIYKNKVTGIISLIRGKQIYRIKAELGYWIGAKYQNKGIVTSAIKGLVKYGFEKLNLQKIEAFVFDFNLASARVLEKNKFTLCHTFKNHAIKEQKIIDLKYYAMQKDFFTGK